MSATTATPRFTRTPHLVGLVAEAERLAALLAGAPDEAVAAIADDQRARSAIASMQLDGSPITQVPELDADGVAVPGDAGAVAGGSWFNAMGVFSERDSDAVVAVEYLGMLAALASDDLAATLLTEPAAALAALHRRLTRGLVDDDSAGRLRATEQAVHDASTGRIIYYAPAPAEIASRLALLDAWVQTAGAREHGLVLSGVLHVELMHLHPYEAANGRLARAAARLALRARGLDPHAIATPEVSLAADPMGYYEDVAATARRRDLTIWLERWGEAVSDGLRQAARRLGLLHPTIASRARGFLDEHAGAAFTIADYRAGAAVGPEEARADVEALLDAAAITRVLGSRGLRFERAAG